MLNTEQRPQDEGAGQEAMIVQLASTRSQPGWDDEPEFGSLPPVEVNFVLDCLEKNEEGDALLFAHLFRRCCVYDHTERAWYLWLQHHWEYDWRGYMLLLACDPLARVYQEAARLVDGRTAALTERANQVESRGQYPGLPLTALMENRHEQAAKEYEQRYKILAEEIREEAKDMKKQSASLNQRARQLTHLPRMKRVLEIAASMLPIAAEQWDTHSWLLGTPEGTLDLRSGELRAGDPQDYIRTAIPTTWKGLDEPAPRFERFLQEIFADREEQARVKLIGFVQRVLGYGLTGNVGEHVFLMLYGEEGRNGKDTLVSTLQAVLGKTVGVVSNDVIIAGSRFTMPGSAKPHLCSLQGKRMAWASEPGRGAVFDIGQVKYLTGGGSIAARQLYGREFSFEPSHLLLLLTNHKPHADASDRAFWERICPLLFNIRFVDRPTQANERKRDTTLVKSMEAEASGILAWLVRGCLDWQRQGLCIPAEILQARAGYRDEEDTLGDFLKHCCVHEASASIRASALYERYKDWAQENNLKALNGNAFGIDIKKRVAFVHKKEGKCYLGIRLRGENEPEEDDTTSESVYEDTEVPIAHETEASAYTSAQQLSYEEDEFFDPFAQEKEPEDEVYEDNDDWLFGQ